HARPFTRLTFPLVRYQSLATVQTRVSRPVAQVEVAAAKLARIRADFARNQGSRLGENATAALKPRSVLHHVECATCRNLWLYRIGQRGASKGWTWPLTKFG